MTLKIECIKIRMLKNQNLESSIPQTKKPQKSQRMHNLSPLSPHDNNMPLPMVKKLDKFEFSLQQKLGSGMAGDVYVGINTETGELVCVKVIDKELFKIEKQKTMLEHEIKCQRLVQCPNTIKIIQVFDQTPFCFIITEFCQGGDLYRFLRFTPDGIPQPLVKKIGFEVAKALLKLKQMKIIHRDIKPENILIRQETAKLGDFGFAIEQKELQNKEQMNIGSPLYMSLQALENNQYSYASDVFSYGIVLYEMLHKVSPWECNDETVLKQKIRTEPVRFKEGICEQLKDLINKCLQIRPEDRITIENIVEHQFFKTEEIQNQEQKQVIQEQKSEQKISETSV